MVAANNLMLPLMLLGDDIDNDKMKDLMIMNSMGLSQSDPMTQLLPLMLLDDDTDTSSDDLMMLMMMNPSAINDPNMMLPFMLMGDDSIDLTNMFLMTSMMQKDCVHDTNNQMNMMLSLLMDLTLDDDMLKTLLMFQMMSPNPSGLDINSILPMLMLEDDSSDPLMLILLSNMVGAGSYIGGEPVIL